MLKELNKTNFDVEVNKGLKLIEFYTSWCGYCKKQQVELEQMNKIWIGQVEADQNPELASRFKINAYPTFLIFNNGKEVERIAGYRQKEILLGKIMKYLR